MGTFLSLSKSNQDLVLIVINLKCYLTFFERSLFDGLSDRENCFDENSHAAFWWIDPTDNAKTQPFLSGALLKLKTMH